MAARRRKLREKDVIKLRRRARPAEIREPEARERRRGRQDKRRGGSSAGDVLGLQRLVGNRAVARLLDGSGRAGAHIQRTDELAGASKERFLKYFKEAVGKSTKGRKKLGKGAWSEGDYHEAAQTGRIKIISYGAAVMSSRRFFGAKKVATVKRGDTVIVLGMKGDWLRVKMEDGKLGWAHKVQVIPLVMTDPSAKPLIDPGGHTRDEIVIGGRG